ncbi:asparaginase [Bacillaceae bacterium JMAK1]|nr:asparaginase [Bacillaceae bacterium JMAK1]
MQTICLLATGGTIASKQTKEGRLVAGELSGEELANSLHTPFDIRLKIDSVLSKPSIQITYDDLWEIRKKVVENLRAKDISGVVVTTGTDTLEEVAYFLDLTVQTSKPVIVTGSQRGPEQVGSDAFVNLRNAMIAAADERVKDLGTVVIFNERIFSAKYVRKEHASNIQGFNAFGYGYFGIIDNDQVHLFQKPISKEAYVIADDYKPNKPYEIEIVKVHLGATNKMLDFVLQDERTSAVIIEGVGRGQVPKNFMPSIREAKIPIVVTTSAVEGEVYPSYEYEGSTYDLLNHDVILGKDYSSKKAKIKLYVLLATGQDSYQHAFDR